MFKNMLSSSHMTNIFAAIARENQSNGLIPVEYAVIVSDSRTVTLNSENSVDERFQKVFESNVLLAFSGHAGLIQDALHGLHEDYKNAHAIETVESMAQWMLDYFEAYLKPTETRRLEAIIVGPSKTGMLTIATLNATGNYEPYDGTHDWNQRGHILGSYGQAGRGQLKTSPLRELAFKEGYLTDGFSSVDQAIITALDQNRWATLDRSVNDIIQIGMARGQGKKVDYAALYPDEMNVIHAYPLPEGLSNEEAVALGLLDPNGMVAPLLGRDKNRQDYTKFLRICYSILDLTNMFPHIQKPNDKAASERTRQKELLYESLEVIFCTNNASLAQRRCLTLPGFNR